MFVKLRPPRAAIDRDRWLAVAVALFLALMFIPDPEFPARGLDPSWVLANEHAARAGLVFGRDYVFSYGPLAFLSTRLFNPSSFALVLAGELFLTLLFVAPLWRAAGRAPALLYLAVAAMAPFGPDPRLAIASLALLAVLLHRRDGAALLLVALLAPFLLAKYSYALATLPLLALADAKHLAAARRVPLFVPTALAALVACQLALGQPLDALPALVTNVGDIVNGYGGAMQFVGGRASLGIALLTIAALAGLAFWLGAARWRAATRDVRWQMAAFVAGLGWIGFIVFKMGHVRQDLHLLTTWQSLIAAVPVVAATFAAIAPLARREILAAAALLGIAVAGTMGFTQRRDFNVALPSPPLADYVEHRAGNLVVRPLAALAWLTPARWQDAAAQRTAALHALVRPFPAGLGTVDAIPYDIAPLIASGLDYAPRPIPQSYSAYTARLQRLDAAHFADPRTAPATLFLKLGDIDTRLPTLATGPTLPVLLRWYDPAGRDPLGTVLRHRASPRPAMTTAAGTRSFALGEPIAVPSVPGALTVARITLPRTLLGKLSGFLLRDPVLRIAVTFADGATQDYRFVPGMAEAGFVLSPLPRRTAPDGLADAAPLFAPGTPGFGRVRSIAIDGPAGSSLAFGRGEIAFETLRTAR